MNKIQAIINKISTSSSQLLDYVQEKPKIRNGVILVGLVALLGAAVLLITRTTTAARSAAEIQSVLATPFPDNPLIEEMKAELLYSSLSKPARASVLEKLTMTERMASEKANGEEQAQKEKVPPPLPTSSALMMDSMDVKEGIFEGSQGMIRPSMADISNCWQGVRGRKIMQVFAGSLSDQTGQAVVIIFQENPNQMNYTATIMPIPGVKGKLRIVSVKDEKMTLKAEDKSKVFFDLEKMAIVK